MLNLASILDTSAREHKTSPALSCLGTILSYEQLHRAANQVANALKQSGIGEGDRVVLSCPNLPYFPIVYYGILKVGAVVVPINVLLKQREVAYHLRDSQAKAYFCFEGTPELSIGEIGWNAFQEIESCQHFWIMTADPKASSPIHGVSTLMDLRANQSSQFETVGTSSEDTAVILYTSGTTGYPKGAELSHMNLFMNALAAKDLMANQPDETQLIVLPLFHSFGQVVQMNTGIFCGQKLVLLPRFEPGTTLMLLEQEKVNVFCGVPTMFWALLNVPIPEDVSLDKIAKTLRLCASGGAPIPIEILKQFEAKFNVPILEGYGLSETSPIATFNHLNQPRKPGSVGTPIWGVDVKVVDPQGKEVLQGEVGEVIIRGHNVMKGYFQNEVATQEAMRNGWFHSGDMGKKDKEGYLFIVDRVKDMIIRGGFNVYPREIEEILLTHPSISLAAVIGIPHEKHGEEIKAYVVLKPGAVVREEDIIQWLKEIMADYKYPRYVEIRASLPMTATGKILKKELRR